MKTSATNRRLHQLLTAVAEKKLNPRPDFQRRLVWTNDDKVAFIRTVLRSLPFPEIYVCAGTLDPDTGQATEFLVDGQQRITTLYQYFTGQSTLRLGDLTAYSALSTPDKMAFLEYEVVVRDLGKHPIEEIREIFELINSANYALNSIEINNARYAGAFKKFAEEISKRPEFKKWKVFRSSDERRMQDLRYCLVLCSTLLSTYFNRDDEIENYLRRYNDAFPEEQSLRSEMNACFAFIEELTLSERSRAFRKTDIFSLFVEVHRALFKRKLKLDPKITSERLTEFFSRVDAVPLAPLIDDKIALTYYRTTVRAAIDRSNRYRRGEILQSILDPSYTPNLKFSTTDPAALQDELDLYEAEEGDY